jgi:hypothetical protein
VKIRDEHGAISPAEGCLFGAMALFALLLIALLVIAVLRFSHPPEGTPMGATPVPAQRSAIHV